MTHGPGSGGYHWRSEEHVAGWDATRSRLDPLREAGFRTMLDQLSTDRLAPLRIVDLGAGDGRVASPRTRLVPVGPRRPRRLL